jgi:pilus assembly protein Flp/PilA
MIRFANRLRRDPSGATAIEYALIAAFVAVIAATAIGGLGTRLSVIFQTVAAALP